eukprot:TRINITY_DN24900_c0_g1_i1.p2 TRINITY_DN24900_c0_g1~~TRINITY_DN24900_c0_g1_i1.p2  ORF type:complete len:110 (-),score=7.25 TRINITY_DN24900_c0_g1_i1:181-510(-)
MSDAACAKPLQQGGPRCPQIAWWSFVGTIVEGVSANTAVRKRLDLHVALLNIPGPFIVLIDVRDGHIKSGFMCSFLLATTNLPNRKSHERNVFGRCVKSSAKHPSYAEQ